MTLNKADITRRLRGAEQLLIDLTIALPDFCSHLDVTWTPGARGGSQQVATIGKRQMSLEPKEKQTVPVRKVTCGAISCQSRASLVET
jgi:hypothetical protein